MRQKALTEPARRRMGAPKVNVKKFMMIDLYVSVVDLW
jgi:hypothetical protein